MVGKVFSDEPFPWRERVSVLSQMSNKPLYLRTGRALSLFSEAPESGVRTMNLKRKISSEKLLLKGSRSGNMLPESELGENWMPEKVN